VELAQFLRLAAETVHQIDSRFAKANLHVVITPLPGKAPADHEVRFTDPTGRVVSPPMTYSGQEFPWPHGAWTGPLSQLPEDRIQ